MKNCRLSYDRVFLSQPPFEYKGRLVTGASLDLLFKFFIDGKEVFFEESDHCQAQGQYVCSVHPDNGYVIKFKPSDNKYIYDEITCEATGWQLNVYAGSLGALYDDIPTDFASMPISEPIDISKDEFIEVIRDHWECFNSIDNKHAQCCAYAHIAVQNQ